MKLFRPLLAFVLALGATPAHAIETRSACITVNDVQIVSGEEKTVQKQLCRSAGSARYDLVQDSAYGAAVTTAAFDRAADPELRVLRGQIESMRGQVQAGQALNEAMRGDLSRAQQEFVAKLAEKNRAYAEAIARFAGTVTSLSASPEGAAALAQYNAGREVAAIAVLKQLVVANARALELANRKREVLSQARQLREVALLELDARKKGKITTAELIADFETVVRLDSSLFDDWMNLGFLYEDNGRMHDTIRSIEFAKNIADNDRDRMIASGELGRVLMIIGNLAAAQKATADALAIARHRAAAYPDDYLAQRDLLDGLQIFGEIYEAQKNNDKARKTFEESVKIGRKIVAKFPKNLSNTEGELADILIDFGNILIKKYDFSGASDAYNESLLISRKNLAHDSSRVWWLATIALALDKFADLRASTGDLAGASMAFQECLDIRRRLAMADRSNFQAQRDLAALLFKLAGKKLFGVTWQNVVSQYETMAASGSLDPIDEKRMISARDNTAHEHVP